MRYFRSPQKSGILDNLTAIVRIYPDPTLQMAKILLAEDDIELARTVSRLLTLACHLVEVAHTGDDGLDRALEGHYDLIILDVGLPQVSGFEICRRYRQNHGMAPVIILTGKTDISDKEIGFNCGADDYVTKPFSMKELGLRVQALLRRPAQFSQEAVAGPFRVDSNAHRIYQNDVPLTLSPVDYKLLEFFIRNPNHTFPGEVLIDRVWPTDQFPTLDALRSSLKRIRQQIDSPLAEESLIETVKKVGYRLNI